MKTNRRIEDPNMNPHGYTHFIFLQSCQKTYDGKRAAFSTNVAGKIGYLHTEN
jgi:hypothetical protein